MFKQQDSVKRKKVKIQPIKNFYNPFSVIKTSSNNNNISITNPFKSLQGDVVSFSAKQYGVDSILNPTNHCGYCGCKLYNETQIDSMAKEMLAAKATRLEGRIKSILEKLADAKHSQELAVAKRMENKDEIDFFNNLLETSSKKPYLRGEELFKQVYHMEQEQATQTLVKNMRPLLKTIDHISPQREEHDNENSDINLVEACYCCNHDLKKGASFNEFYMMFPTIKNNMPKEKFQYALSQILDSSQNQVLQRLSASNMLKFLERLFVQRTETANALSSIDFRIQGCKSGIQDSIETCRKEISDKETEKSELEKKLDELKKDPEYTAMLERVSLQEQLASVTTQLDGTRGRRQKLTESLNALKSTHKRNKKNKTQQMSDEDKQKRIEQIRKDIELVTGQITEQENEKFEIELKIEELNMQHPTIEMQQGKKMKADSIVNAYNAIEKDEKLLSENRDVLSNLEADRSDIQSKLDEMPEETKSFNLESFSPEEQESYKTYKDLLEALAYINEHPNGGSIRVIIHSKAKEPIEESLLKLEELPVIKAYKASEHRKELENKLEKIQKNIYDITAVIHQLEKTIRNNRRIADVMPKEEAQKQSNELAQNIRYLTDRQNNIQLPKIIAKITAEIELLHQTIEDLTAKQKKIEESYS